MERINSKFAYFNINDVMAITRNGRNRNVNAKHVKAIQNGMLKMYAKTGDPFEGIAPVILNVVTGNVVEGQHRTAAFMGLVKDEKLPINSVMPVMFTHIESADELEYIIDANKNMRGWKLEDYVHAHSDDPQIVEFMRWAAKQELCCGARGAVRIRTAAAICKGHNCDTQFMKATCGFTFNETDRARGNAIHSELKTLVRLMNVYPAAIPNLASAWVRVRDFHSFAEWEYAMRRMQKTVTANSKHFNVKDFTNIFSLVHANIDFCSR